MESIISKRMLVVSLFMVIGYLFSNFTSAQADIFKKASSIQHLYQSSILPGEEDNLDAIDPSGENLGSFTVPAGNVFVITSIVIKTQPISGSYSVNLGQRSGINRFRLELSVPANETKVFNFPTGLVIGPGFILNIYNGNSSPGSIDVNVIGYLTNY